MFSRTYLPPPPSSLPIKVKYSVKTEEAEYNDITTALLQFTNEAQMP